MDEITNQANSFISRLAELAALYLPRVLLAIVTLIIGLWLINIALRILTKGLEKRSVDQSLKPFLRSVIGALLKIVLFISIASMVGIETTSFIAIIGAAGLAVGLALQGSLANFAGGVLILLLKPFKVGDFITGGGQSGTVSEIQIFYTVLTTPENQKIVVPNGQLSNSSITNYSSNPTRRLDLVYGIGYEDNIDKAREIIKNIIGKDERVLKDPEPQIIVTELGDSSVNITVRLWANLGDFWGLKWDLIEQVKKEFDKNNISIPFPQRDVHLFQEK